MLTLPPREIKKGSVVPPEEKKNPPDLSSSPPRRRRLLACGAAAAAFRRSLRPLGTESRRWRVASQRACPLVGFFGEEFYVNFHKMARGPNLRSGAARWSGETRGDPPPACRSAACTAALPPLT